jgi:hypothetical protein
MSIAWGLLSLLSMLVFAFTGAPLWAPVGVDGEGFIRFSILFAFHLGGVIALIASCGV